MSLYGRFFAAAYDRIMAASEQAGLAERRARLLTDARGRVVEVGAGTGLNLGHYPAAVDELVLVEPARPMHERLQKKVAGLTASGRRATVVQAPAEALPFADDSFDTAVCTLVLCTVDDPGRALEEIDRVLRPGGALLFMEHVRSDDPRLARWQDRLEGVWLRIGHGCHCNRSTGRLIEDSRLALDRIEHDAIPKAMPLVRPLVIGRANAG